MPGVLQELRFQPLDVTVLNTGSLSRVLVKWTLEPTAQDLRNLFFFIDRGESPFSMRQLNANGVPASALREYVDFTANLYDLQKVYYYRVRAVEFAGANPVQTFTSSVQTWDGTLDLVGIYVVEEHLFLHRYVAGIPSLIFKKRREGPRCPQCWDPVLKRVTSSKCATCYGTGIVGGYYAPIEGWIDYEPDPKMMQIAEWGMVQPNQTNIVFTNYPLLSVDDLVLELKINKFWKVSRIQAAEKNRSSMLQFARVDAVNPSDIEYKIPVPEERRKHLVAELARRDMEREF